MNASCCCVNFLRLFAMLLAAATLASPAFATIQYDFVDEGTPHDVLAQLVLSDPMPAGGWTHSNIVSLSFTVEGSALFGYGIGLYFGSFDDSDGTFADDGFGGLYFLEGPFGTSLATFTDNDPPSSTLPDGVNKFSIGAQRASGGDVINYATGQVSGDWVLSNAQVPEPASIGIWALLAAGGAGIARSRRRRRIRIA